MDKDPYKEFLFDYANDANIYTKEPDEHKKKTRRRCKICNKLWCSQCYYRQRKSEYKICNKTGCINCMIQKDLCKRCFHKSLSKNNL